MKSVRRPAAALITMLMLVTIQAFADPTGVLALVGWSGAIPQPSAGVWPIAAYLVYVPVLLVVLWWATVRAGDRYWTLVPGVVVAVMLAQAAAAFVMSWDLAVAAWAAGYVTAKAVPAALIVAAFTRWFGGRTTRRRVDRGAIWLPAALFAAVAPLVAGLWWTGAAYAPGVPAARLERGPVSVIVTMVLIAGATALCLRWMRARVPGVLGGWLAALVAGGIVGVVQALIAVAVDGGFNGDIWPLMTAYITVADGLSFGACLGWVAGVTAVVSDRVRAGRPARAFHLAAALLAVLAVGASLVLSAVGSASAAPATASSGDEAIPKTFLRADGGVIRDGDGDQVMLRGVNVNQLVDFYRPRADVAATDPLTEGDFAGIAALGFDVVRLNLSWSALEPERGAFDQTYVDRISEAVGWAKAHGLYVVLDMHQDAWWSGATPDGTQCRPGTDPMWGYDGAPEWATITDGAPRCQFQGRDISPAGNRAFQNFYFDTDGIQSALVETWGRLAAVFADEPTVAGYDLLNEPGFGETAPVTTSYLLGRYYDRAIEAIRSAGAPQIVFVEPSILWSGLGFDSGPPQGFTSDRNIVFSPHLYAESLTMDRSLGIPSIVGMDRQFTLAKRVADAYGAPVWSGEIGYWGDRADVIDRLGRYAKAEDANLLGSAYWVWKQACGDPQGGIVDVTDALSPTICASGKPAPTDAAKLGILSRAYPRTAPGELTSLTADGADVALAGTADTPGCGLEVWIPGTSQPEVHVTGITNLETTAVDGGWSVTGCAEGEYTLFTNP
ncbi:glycoside hydrolase family 5 protein [Microbacterium deminutum]|uniref:Glycoside hydrolase family 5 domain-containing protein n=1 Tax=Microbacterium deminutum TaxID=344164 RepID=A0ABN2QF55_9MICO